MTGPNVPDSAFIERAGVIHFASLANSARVLWRETLMHDVGIDGHVEHVSPDGSATGRTVAVQIKSGKSFFPNGECRPTKFTPAEKHREYWANYPHPVVLVIYHPEHRRAFWADARRALRSRESTAISVENHLTVEAFSAMLSIAGPLPTVPMLYADLLNLMVAQTADSPSRLTFFDLFVCGLTDTVHSIYFGMDLYTDLVGYKLQPITTIDLRDHHFISRYVNFLVANGLARVDFDWFDEVVQEREQTGQILAPLTRRGRALVEYIIARDRKVGGSFELRPGDKKVAQERFVGVKDSISITRLDWIEHFKEQIRR